MRKKILLIGGPSVGKGSTLEVLVGHYKDTLAHIGTGEEVRRRIKEAPDSEFSKQALPYVVRGELIPDEFITPVGLELFYQAEANEKASLYGLDGFPRCASQLDELVSRKLISSHDTVAVILHASEETLWKRVYHRFIHKHGGSRPDESSELKKLRITFQRRIKSYKEEYPALRRRLLSEKFRIHQIDANREIPVFAVDVLAVAKSFWVQNGGARSVVDSNGLNGNATISSRMRLARAYSRPDFATSPALAMPPVHTQLS